MGEQAPLPTLGIGRKFGIAVLCVMITVFLASIYLWWTRDPAPQWAASPSWMTLIIVGAGMLAKPNPAINFPKYLPALFIGIGIIMFFAVIFLPR